MFLRDRLYDNINPTLLRQKLFWDYFDSEITSIKKPRIAEIKRQRDFIIFGGKNIAGNLKLKHVHKYGGPNESRSHQTNVQFYCIVNTTTNITFSLYCTVRLSIFSS